MCFVLKVRGWQKNELNLTPSGVCLRMPSKPTGVCEKEGRGVGRDACILYKGRDKTGA